MQIQCQALYLFERFRVTRRGSGCPHRRTISEMKEDYCRVKSLKSKSG